MLLQIKLEKEPFLNKSLTTFRKFLLIIKRNNKLDDNWILFINIRLILLKLQDSKNY